MKEIIGFLPHQFGLDVLVNEGNKILRQEQRVKKFLLILFLSRKSMYT